MRDELRRFDFKVYGPRVDDFDWVFDLILRVRDSHLAVTSEKVKAYVHDPDLIEVVDDKLYYAYLDTVYLWEYALWRFQGMLEALVSLRFLGRDVPSDPRGLRQRLKALTLAGYVIDAADRAELLRWAELRNALSHRPPEPYRPVQIEESDVREYLFLVKRVGMSLELQRPSIIYDSDAES